ncbi:hypothetical protein KG088_09000 [Halomonas sp. TRM85114]|uniref:hypothetical protein n=1 Tax=Halomonas jincaotanensis TaxID=2810616 RepID=UPI001BD67DAA|nr:hypothetical protein [Halomonas jincaotanensis]MBS9403766.1 hypothetical protein [Halomonas jincaotanensis]
MKLRNIAHYATTRRITAVVALAILFLAFRFFLTERMEGGPFVSMLTLGLGLLGISLVWDRVEQFTLFGSEIKLRNLTKSAEHMLSNLSESRVSLYRIALHLVKREAGGPDDLFDSRDERSVDALDLLREIDKADLIEPLASDITATLDVIIDKTHSRLLEAPLFERQGAAPGPDEILRLYDEHAIGNFTAVRQEIPTDTRLSETVEQLRLMLEYRHKASTALRASRH